MLEFITFTTAVLMLGCDADYRRLDPSPSPRQVSYHYGLGFNTPALRWPINSRGDLAKRKAD